MTDWTNVIELICDKLGIVVDSAMDLVPEIVRYNTVMDGLGVLFSFLIMLAGILAVRGAYKWALRQAKKHNYDDEWGYYTGEPEFMVPTIIGGVAAFAAGIIFILQTIEFAGWLAAPNVKAIEWVMSLMG